MIMIQRMIVDNSDNEVNGVVAVQTPVDGGDGWMYQQDDTRDSKRMTRS